MTTLTHRPTTDCLGGRLHRDASFQLHRGVGVRDAPATPDRQARPAHGRQRGRKSRHAGAPMPMQPQKRVMENVVILKRGEKIAPVGTAAPAVAAPAADQCGAQAEKAEPVAAAEQCDVQAKAETAAASGQCGDLAEGAEAVAAKERCSSPEEKTDKAPAEKTETVTDADRCSLPAKKIEAVAAADRKVEVVAAAVQCGAQAKKADTAPTVYSGASFVISPDPCELPIPVFLLNPRGGRTAACA